MPQDFEFKDLNLSQVWSRLALTATQLSQLTGVSRRSGIGAGIARRLVDDDAAVFLTGWSAHDAEQPWGADPGFIFQLLVIRSLIDRIDADTLIATGWYPAMARKAILDARRHEERSGVTHCQSPRAGRTGKDGA